ncbi:MAG TPA: precorrin-4 C(11)-methyltransferase, partial [Dongiaceae bacterium]|nr:precorrin-4 C(11)-methyltransferase [Dongiaceae bacterium]
HLSIRNIGKVVAELTPLYGADCPVVIAFRIGWPDQQIMRGTLADIEARLAGSKISRTAIIFVGRVFGAADFTDSRLYHVDHQHALRPPRD